MDNDRNDARSTGLRLAVLPGAPALHEFSGLVGLDAQAGISSTNSADSHAKKGFGDLLLVLGGQFEQLSETVRRLRNAGARGAIVACVRAADARDRARLLFAGYDDVFDTTLDEAEIAARLHMLQERTAVYDQQHKQAPL